MCKASHFSTQENKPKIVFDEQGNEIGIEKNAYWEIAILPNTDFIISGDNIPDGTITTNKLANSSVTTEKIHGGAVGFAELAENAKGVIINYGDSLDSVKKHLGTYRRQERRMGLYVYDNALGIVPAINSEGNIIRAVSIVKSTGHDDYVDVFILVFDGSKWSRQTYSQVGRVPGNGTVTTPKIANEAVTDIKLAPLSVGESRIKGFAVTTPKIANGAVITPKIADGAVTNDKIAYGAVTNNKISSEAITIDKLELDLEAMVSDNVKYRKQNLTTEQKAQARKNINALEDEVGGIDTEHIADDAVTTPKIANKAVTEQKLSEEVQNKLNSSLKPVILNNATQKINIADVKANPLNYFYDNYVVKIPLKYYVDSPF